jgi:hypothetical protein
MKKKLTYRQQQFLSQFLDVYRDMQHSVSYITVAERLGVGKVTAYEMLRLLEEHGLVSAEYQTNVDQHGPGRSAVHFYPTQQAAQLINNLAGDAATQEEWPAVKEQILQKLREGQVGGYADLLSSLLVRFPERHSPLVFAGELITTIVLTLAAIQDKPEVRTIMEQLRRIGLPQEVGLNVLSGIGLLLSVIERANRRSTTILLTQINRYEAALLQLNEESRRQLGEFTREVVRILSV